MKIRIRYTPRTLATANLINRVLEWYMKVAEKERILYSIAWLSRRYHEQIYDIIHVD